MTEEQLKELLDSPQQAMANTAMQHAMGDLMEQLDNIGYANQDYLEKEGEPAVHMTTLMVNTLMSLTVNVFSRINPEDTQEVHDLMQEFLTEAPTAAAEIRSWSQGENAGHA